MNPRTAENVFSERKRDNRVNVWLGKVKNASLIPSEDVGSKGENAFRERKHGSLR